MHYEKILVEQGSSIYNFELIDELLFAILPSEYRDRAYSSLKLSFKQNILSPIFVSLC
jgi:hypothetical protein